WKARDTELGRVVAVKIPHHGRLDTARDMERFLREARSSAQLRHPGIVSVHEVGFHGATPYLVSDFIDGVRLTDLLESRRMGFHEAAELVARVADAVDYSHSMGVVHRDIKPSNIMLESVRSGSDHAADTDHTPRLDERQIHGAIWSRESSLRPLLMDFGLALRD